jgi:hypothetical protein
MVPLRSQTHPRSKVVVSSTRWYSGHAQSESVLLEVQDTPHANQLTSTLYRKTSITARQRLAITKYTPFHREFSSGGSSSFFHCAYYPSVLEQVSLPISLDHFLHSPEIVPGGSARKLCPIPLEDVSCFSNTGKVVIRDQSHASGSANRSNRVSNNPS